MSKGFFWPVTASGGMMIVQLARRFGAIKAPPVVSLMERSPQLFIYALHVPYSLYLMIRYRGVMLPTIANPGLDGSGLTKESKADLFSLLGPLGKKHLSPFAVIDAGPNAVSDSLRVIATSNGVLKLPVVVKPDIGRRGFGVKLVETEQALSAYLGRFKTGVRLLIQQYAEGPGEAGIFFVRRPSESEGRILSLTIKHFPEVTGDGIHTLRELIQRDPRARTFSKVYFKRNRLHLDQVIESGKHYRLVSIGNHVRGAAFEDGSEHITRALNQVFNAIVAEVPGFFIGRFDVRYKNLEALKRGEEFSIIEYNGAGGEPTHIWDPRTSIFGTYSGLLKHFALLYAIGAENRRLGAVPLTPAALLRRYLDELRLLRTYPDEE